MYKFEKITKDDCAVFSSWMEHKIVRDWIAVDDWGKYFEIVSTEPDYFLIKALFDDKIIAEIALEIIEEVGHIAIMLNPNEQSKGHGKKILKLFCEKAVGIIGREFKYIEAGIFPDNIASKRCFEGAGFKFSKDGDDGEMIYIYDIENN